VARAVALFAADGVYREARREPIVGRDAIAAHWERYFVQGPRWRIDVGEIIADARGERFAIPYVFAVQGPGESWQDRPGCALVRVRNNRITEWREYSG
jgi:limonene-1,2-epoxide hydrolase